MAVPVRLKVFKGDELIATRDFERDMIKIGRLSTAHLCLDDEKASRIHSVLNVEGDGKLSVVDMGSVEGTYLNGRRVNKGVVQFGDEIRIGGTRLVIERVTEEPADESAKPPPPPPPPALEPAPALAAAAQVAVAPAVVAAAPAAEVVEDWTDQVLESDEPPRFRSFKLNEKPFGSYVAQPPVPRRPAEAAGKLGLQVRYLWGDTLLQVTQHPAPKSIFLGPGRGCDLRIDPEQIGSEKFELVSASGDDGFTLHVGENMKGELDRDGAVKPLGPGSYDLRAPDFAWVDVGSVRAELSFSPQPRRVAVPFAESIDFRLINLFLLLAFFAGLFFISASTHTEVDIVADDLTSARLNIAKFLIKEAERPKKNALLEKLAEIKEPQPGEAGERHKGKEGQMGKKGAPVNKNNRSAPKAIDINAKDLVKRSGLVSVLGSGGGGGLATIFGQGGLGGDIKGALGNMFGSRVGDSGGLGGLGLKGTGTGGGGMGNTIGIGGIGTKGRGGGLGTYGVGVGSLDPKKSSDVSIADSESVIQGSLDKELIRQVIRRNIGQIKYCYEKELQTKPNLAGKVAVRFLITPKGTVQTAKVAEGTTLHDRAVGDCITLRVRSWLFPQPKGGGSVIVTYPFVFKQAGE
ncbi:MAG: adventurous gliding motility protein GltG [Myxococcales bacterium]|jgi:hypothetical protein